MSRRAGWFGQGQMPIVRLRRIPRVLCAAALIVAGAGAAVLGVASPAFAATGGTGTMDVSSTVVAAGSTGNTLTFTYTATTALVSGILEVTVPTGWSPPTISTGTAGYTTSACGTVSVTTRTIKVTAVTLSATASCTIIYGSGGGSSGATAQTSPIASVTFTAAESNTNLTATVKDLGTSPSVKVVSANGSGTMALHSQLVSSKSGVAASSTGNTLVLTFKAATGGTTGGKLQVTVPATWTPPSTTSGAAGYTTSTCGTASVSGQVISASGVTVPSGASCTITYGTGGGVTGVTVPSSTGTASFATTESSTSTGPLTTMSPVPSIDVVSANGSGTMAVSPTTVTTSSTGNSLTFTYTAVTGGTSTGALVVKVPSAWSLPSTTSSAAGYTTTTCTGTTNVTPRVTVPGTGSISVSPVTLSASASCSITYSDATAPPAARTGSADVFTAHEASAPPDSPLALTNSPEVAVTAASGGTLVLTPAIHSLSATSPANSLVFVFTAPTGGTTHGKLRVTVPTAWPAPVPTSGTAGYTTSTCGATSLTARTIKVTTVTKGAAVTCTITYGDGTGGGVTAPSTPTTYQFSAEEASTSTSALAAVVSQPTVKVVAKNGSGSMAVSPASVTVSSTANTLTFTYTAAPGGTTGGELVVAVPTGWSAPGTTSGTAGYTTSTCGIVSVFEQNILVGAMTLADTAACTITYGSGGGSSGASAPSTTGTDTFTTAEVSVPANVEPSLASSPTVTVFAPSSGTPGPPTTSESGTSSTPGGIATATSGGTTATASGGEGTVTVGTYSTDPVGHPTFPASGVYLDVKLSAGSTFTSLTVTVTVTNGGDALFWWDSAARGGSGAWESVSPVSAKTGHLVADLSSTSSPTLKQLTGTVFAVGTQSALPASTPTEGYHLVGADGGIFSFGTAGYFGSVPGLGIHVSDIVGMASTPDGKGYWLVGADGGIFSFGDAAYFGSVPGLGIHVGDIVGMVRTPGGAGYWLVGADGGIFSFGDAAYFGSVPGLGIHVGDIVGMVRTPGGAGYWLVGSDGGVFSFGDAVFEGSEGGIPLAAPVVGAAS